MLIADKVVKDQKTVLSMPPVDLTNWITKQCVTDLPVVIYSKEDMDRAAELLLRLTNMYSYLNSLLSYAKIATRQMKRANDKIAYEDMVDRREIIQNATENVKQQYAAVSRAVSIRIENNRELSMNSKGYI